ncbi:Dyp-type peroxidase [Corynebacterium lujinxingii]|uniref:Dyp-type peroxidase n=1 Tax=Corynebacterium lujinxingii TaxID=2763010 RepID=A0A7H0JWG6_9CORY|nr:Dyp-type peroxidase [Corynebacterium lujinxingii]MBC3178881.1 Dyp-type peroxidase [Corynebacterium lujinxingii]NNO11163.1 Dyp-type peroxidase [Corynebacterium lujinxingii]QNP89382.1 Dyp-type peroxidase [Corynebacterium lujinxingii]
MGEPRRGGMSRRVFLAGAGVASSSVALAACSREGEGFSEVASLTTATLAFDGERQAGIATPTQANLNLVGFNLKDGVTADGIRNLMQLWTEDARELAAGRNPLSSLEPEMVERPANLTITCGFGERVFDIAASGAKPQWLHDIPDMPREQLSDDWAQTDLVLQICSDDAVVCAWAMRHMTRAGMDYVRTAWVQQGFMNAYGSIPEGHTPRNLFGQVDGTVNPRSDDEFADQVFTDDGSSSLVVRRIAMDLDDWERLDRTSREEAVGRRLSDGAPLTGDNEFDAPDLDARDEYGLPVIDMNSHMARAMPPADHPGQKFLRRPYNYNLPPEPGSEQLSNAGLVFLAYQKDPDVQFTPVLRRLLEADRLNEWTTHIGSAVYWIPPGTADPGSGEARDAFWGETVLSRGRG